MDLKQLSLRVRKKIKKPFENNICGDIFLNWESFHDNLPTRLAITMAKIVKNFIVLDNGKKKRRNYSKTGVE